MANLQTQVPLANSAFVDSKGNITEAWLMFLIQLWRRTGGNIPIDGSLTIGDVLSVEETFAPFATAVPQLLETTLASLTRNDPRFTEVTLAPAAASTYAQAAKVVTLGASPAAYRATYAQGFHITGGTVTALSVQRGSVVLPIGNSASDIVDATPTFTAGVSTSVTLPSSFGAVSRIWVYFNGVNQSDSQITSLVGTTLTFTSVIPVGVTEVFVKGLLQSSIGVGSTLVELSPGDVVNVTYSSTPTVTILAR